MGSSFWLWELNESWSVRPVAQMVVEAQASPVFIEGNHERPSLNWYAGQKIRRLQAFSNSGWILTRNQETFASIHSDKDCRFIQENDGWALMFCQTK